MIAALFAQTSGAYFGLPDVDRFVRKVELPDGEISQRAHEGERPGLSGGASRGSEGASSCLGQGEPRQAQGDRAFISKAQCGEDSRPEEGVANGEPREAKSRQPAMEAERQNAAMRLRCAHGIAGRTVCNLRLTESAQAFVQAVRDRSLPRERRCSRAPLSPVQRVAWSCAGQRGDVGAGHCVSGAAS